MLDMWRVTVLIVLLCYATAAHSDDERVELTQLSSIPGGTFWFGTQLSIGEKLIPTASKDGAVPRVIKTVKSFQMEIHTVTNAQFSSFVNATKYVTEAETFKWSFVLEHLASEKVIKQVDSKKGYGRVKDSTHWMAVPRAHWAKPYGRDSPSMLSDEARDLPVVHVSFNDAKQYCKWAGRRLPTEVEWEYAARGGRVKQNYPWGDEFAPGRMNIWEGTFPKDNTLQDGHLGPAPVTTYAPNKYGLYNMVGNVWEWVAGGKAEARILRGGSFIDSADGRFNHIVMVSTKQENSGDSTASNAGFRCAVSVKGTDSGESGTEEL